MAKIPKNKNILFTCNHMKAYGGTQRWVETMAEYLSEWNFITILVKEFDYKKWGHLRKFAYVATDIKDVALEEFDYGVLAHNRKDVVKNCKKRIGVSHGKVPAEKPIPGCHKYVAVSEFVKHNWEDVLDKAIFTNVVHNPVNLEEFRVIREPNEKIERVAHVSPYTDIPHLEEACKEMGIEFRRAKSEKDMLEVYNWADLVVGFGRCCFEAMACGREVFIYDFRSYINKNEAQGDGLASKVFEESLKFNCDGLRFKRKYSKEEIKEMFRYYDKETALNNRELIKEQEVSKVCKVLF